MRLFPRFFFSVITAIFAVSCTTVEDPGNLPGRPYIPRVTMPLELNTNEANLIGDVELSLEQNGLRPTDRTNAEYQLEFSVEDGPVNADVTLSLFQGRNRVAHAYARVGGPRIIVQRQRVIREAFESALQQFESQLPRSPAPPSYRETPGNYPQGTGQWQDQNPYPGSYPPPPLQQPAPAGPYTNPRPYY